MSKPQTEAQRLLAARRSAAKELGLPVKDWRVKRYALLQVAGHSFAVAIVRHSLADSDYRHQDRGHVSEVQSDHPRRRIYAPTAATITAADATWCCTGVVRHRELERISIGAITMTPEAEAAPVRCFGVIANGGSLRMEKFTVELGEERESRCAELRREIENIKKGTFKVGHP